MNKLEFFYKDGQPANLWQCGKCSRVSKVKEWADNCCACIDCKIEIDMTSRYCDACYKKTEEAKEKSRFESAKKVTFWDGPVFHGDDYFEDIELFIDSFDGEDHDIPAYVWTADKISLVDVRPDLIIDHIDESSYDGFDPANLKGLEEFYRAVRKFNDANKHHIMYEPNYKRALLLESHDPATLRKSDNEANNEL